jgi:hypothetical protein
MEKTFYTFLCSIIITISYNQTIQCAPSLYSLNAPKILFGATAITFVGFYLGVRFMQDLYTDVDKELGLPVKKDEERIKIGKETIGEFDTMSSQMGREVDFFRTMRRDFNQREQNKQLCSCCSTSHILVTRVFKNNFVARRNELKDIFTLATKRVEEI